MQLLRYFCFSIHMHALLENQESEELLLVRLSSFCLNLQLRELSILHSCGIDSFFYRLILQGPQKSGDGCLVLTAAPQHPSPSVFLPAPVWVFSVVQLRVAVHRSRHSPCKQNYGIVKATTCAVIPQRWWLPKEMVPCVGIQASPVSYNHLGLTLTLY